MKYFTVNSSTTVDQLKARYRDLSKQMHPDKGGSNDEFVAMSEEFQRALTMVATQTKSTQEQFDAIELLEKIKPFLGKKIDAEAIVALGIALMPQDHIISKVLTLITSKK